MNDGLYNNDVGLFRAAVGAYRVRNIRLIVVDGHVFAGSDGCVARFANDEAACKVLTEAGYVRDEVMQNVVFEAPSLTPHPWNPAQRESGFGTNCRDCGQREGHINHRTKGTK